MGSYAFSAQMSDIRRSAQLVRDCVAKSQPADTRNVALSAVHGNTGDCGSQGSPLGGDKEFFLDEFDSMGFFTQRPAGVNLLEEQATINAGKCDEIIPSRFEAVRKEVGTKEKELWTSSDRVKPSASGEGDDSLSVRVLVSKKRPLSTVSEDEMLQWRLAEFMTSSRSASQQAAIELGVQMSRGQFFAPGCLHSMIRCTEQPESLYAELVGHFLASTADNGDAGGAERPRCSQSGCTQQAQSRGLCMTHGGSLECTYPGCVAISRWQGRCGLHGGRCTCSDAKCTKGVRSGGKCVEHCGSRAKCLFPNCTSTVQRKGLCSAHGGSLSCTVEGCSKKVLTKGLCGSHGGGLRCKSDGCNTLCHYRGFCQKHAVENGVPIARKGRCKVEGCLKFKLIEGYCTKHAKERGIAVGHQCKTEGCEKFAQAGGHCVRHGGGLRCTHPGCGKSATSKGLCTTHGGRVTCKIPGCTKWGLSKGVVKGYCIQHGGGKRCKHPGCNKSIQRKGLCCTHGGWYACQAEGCNKRLRLNGFCATHTDSN